METLPNNSDNIHKTAKNIKKFGLFKFIGLQILKFFPVIVISIITASTTSKITVKNQLSSVINNDVKTKINVIQNKENAQIQTAELQKENSQTGLLKNFDQNFWIFSQAKPEITDDGFYCPKNVAFPSWFIWTERKFIVGDEIKIVFRLKDKTKNDKPPTLLLSYGDKVGNKPDIFYQMNILDGDPKTIRLYDKNQYDVGFDRSENEPNLENDLVLTVGSFFPKSNLIKLILYPELSFKLENDKPYTFVPNKEFSISEIPLAGIDQQGEGKSFGIGVSIGDCFKIISSNLQ